MSESVEKILEFKTGKLSIEEVELVLDNLPVDVTFVDSNDEVKYFNKLEDRMFKRSLCNWS